MAEERSRDAALDLARGISAFVVMLSHLRGFIFTDYSEQGQPGILTKLFFFATGLGHQAVIVFFVLSGYFVGGSVIASLARGGFSWQNYLVARLTRLWIVLIPALVLTWCLDAIGMQFSSGAYAGQMREPFSSGPTSEVPAADDLATLLGNVLFLQTVVVPVFGSNGPLWSLANEFWYYILFALVAFGVSSLLNRQNSSQMSSYAACGSFAVLLWMLPVSLLLPGLIWVAGVITWFMVGRAVHLERQAPRNHDRSAASRVGVMVLLALRGRTWGVLGGAFFLLSLAASKTGNWFGSDYAIGGVFSLWLLALANSGHVAGPVRRVASLSAEISYTLYTTHFPILFLFSVAVLQGRQWELSAAGLLWFSAAGATTLACAGALWWIFERNTNRLRRWCSALVIQRWPPGRRASSRQTKSILAEKK